MAFPRVVGTFNIKDPEDQAIYNEITSVGRGLLSEVCCAALRQWKGTNLNIEETKRRLAEIQKEKAQIQEDEIKMQQRLHMLQLTEGIKEKENKEPKKRLDMDRTINKAKSNLAYFFNIKDPARLTELSSAWWLEASANDIASELPLDDFLIFFAQKYSLRFIRYFPFLKGKDVPAGLLPETEAKKQ